MERRGEGKQLKRDQQVRRDVLQEIGLEIVQDWPGPWPLDTYCLVFRKPL